MTKKSSKSILMLTSLGINPVGAVRGTPTIRYTIEAFLAHGWKICYLVGSQPKPTHPEIVNRIRVSWFWLPFRTGLGRLSFLVQSLWYLLAQLLFFVKGAFLIKKCSPDVIYSWDVRAVPAAYLLSRIFYIPWVARFMGTSMPAPSEAKNSLFKLRWWRHIIGYRLASKADLVIMTNDGTKGDKVLRELGVPPEKIRFWMNGVRSDFIKFRLTKEEAKARLGLTCKKVILSLSRLDTWKRVDRCISLMPRIVQEYQDVKLIVVGDGKKRKEWELLSKKLGVHEYVEFKGAVEHSMVGLYFLAADVFCSMFDLSNVGNPLLEALTFGKAIVTLDVGGTREIIKHCENGLIFPPEKIDEVGDAIVKLLKDDNLRRKLEKGARTYAKHNLKSWDERLKMEIEEIEKIIGRKINRRLMR